VGKEKEMPELFAERHRDFAKFLVPRLRLDADRFKEKIKERWCIYCYLIINWRVREVVDGLQWELPQETLEAFATHLYAYVYKDEMPPEAIATTVLNAADSFIRGDAVKLGAGDYIALGNWMRG
jgi:hypothetical protein